MNICNINDVELGKLELKEPLRIQGGAFFSQIKHNNEDLYVNTPKSNTKNGIVKTGKRNYVDLLYDENNHEMANWILDLEKHLKQKLFEKSSLWFHNDMDLDDIDYFFNSPLRTYKGNKYLLRCNVVNNTKNPSSSVQIYDESENLKDVSDVEGKSILSIIQIKGIRFTSNSFHLEIVLRQTMILDEKPLFSGCLIKPRKQSVATTEENIDSLLVESNTNDNSIISNPVILDNKSSDLEDLIKINTAEEIQTTDKEEENQTIDKEEEIQTTDKEQEIQTTDKEEENQTIDKEEEIQTTDKEEKDETIDKEENQTTNKEEPEKEVSLEIIDGDKKEILEESINEPNDLDELKNVQDLGDIDIIDNTNENLEEFLLDINSLENETPITLKKPNEVYYEIYREARRKAKIAKKAAVIAYLEAKNIKNTYMLDDMSDSSDEEFEDDDINLEQT